MNKIAAFEAGFQDEILKLVISEDLQKAAGFGDVLFTLGKAVGKAKSMAAPLIERAGATSAGQYLAKSPRLSGALRFSGTMAAGGAGFELANKALAPKKKEVHILPEPMQQGVMPQFQS